MKGDSIKHLYFTYVRKHMDSTKNKDKDKELKKLWETVKSELERKKLDPKIRTKEDHQRYVLEKIRKYRITI